MRSKGFPCNLGHGALAVVRDQSQDVSLQLVIEHQARPCDRRTSALNGAHMIKTSIAGAMWGSRDCKEVVDRGAACSRLCAID